MGYKYQLRPLDIESLKLKASLKDMQPSGQLRGTIRRARKIIKILERDNFKCTKCPSKSDLTIDHINGRKFAKHDNAKKYRLEECEILCIKCHNNKNFALYTDGE